MAGALLGLVITAPFALAYDDAYGLAHERPRTWVTTLGQLVLGIGSGGTSAVTTYHRLGLFFGVCLLAVTAGAWLVWPRPTSRLEAVALWMTTGGLLLATVGTFADYGLPALGPTPNPGFALELIGFLLVALSTPVLALAARRRGASLAAAICLGVLGPVGMVGGTWAVGHIPSGPAAVVLVGALVVGVTASS